MSSFMEHIHRDPHLPESGGDTAMRHVGPDSVERSTGSDSGVDNDVTEAPEHRQLPATAAT
jgi:hypothetical protein